MKCPICDRKTQNSATYCQEHTRELAKVKAEASKRKQNNNAEKYVAYRGHVVGFFKRNGSLVPRYIGMSTAGIPKVKLVNFNEYCNGYTRDQVKKLKATVLALSGI